MAKRKSTKSKIIVPEKTYSEVDLARVAGFSAAETKVRSIMAQAEEKFFGDIKTIGHLDLGGHVKFLLWRAESRGRDLAVKSFEAETSRMKEAMEKTIAYRLPITEEQAREIADSLDSGRFDDDY